MRIRQSAWLLLLLLTGLAAMGDEALESSPWVGWRKGYECYDRAGRFKADNQYREALALYTESRDYFLKIRQHFPDWNRKVIAGRVRLCEEEIVALGKLVGGVPIAPVAAAPSAGYAPGYGVSAASPPVAPVASVAPVGGGRLYLEMQSELDQYKQRLRSALVELDDLRMKLQQTQAKSSDVEGLLRDYRLLQEKYALLEVQYRNAKAQSGGSSVEREALQNQLLAVQLKSDELSGRAAQLENRLVRQDEEYATARRAYLALQKSAADKDDQIKRLERELTLLSNQPRLAAEQQERITGLTADKAALNSELVQKNERIAALNQMLAEAAAGKGASEATAVAENRRLQSELETLRRELSRLDVETQRRRIAELTADKAALAETLQQSQARQAQLETEHRLLTQQTVNQSRAAELATAELKALRTRSAQLEEDLKSWSLRYDELKKRHDERLAADALTSTAQSSANQELTRKLAALEKQYAQLSGAHATLKLAQKRDADAVAAVRQTMMELKSAAVTNEIELKKMADLQKAYDRIAGELAKRGGGNRDVSKELARITGLEESLRRYEDENKNLLGKLDRAQRELKSLQLKLNESGDRRLAAAGGALTDIAATLAPERIETLLADANGAELEKRYEMAIWGYRQVLNRDPENLEANRRLGGIYLMRGEYPAASRCFAVAASKHPADALLLKDTMRALIGDKKYDEALQRLADFKQRHRPDLPLLLAEAVAWSRSGKSAEAEKAFKAVLNVDGGNGEAAYELAMLLSVTPERLREAADYYRMARAAGIAPDSYLEETLKPVMGSDAATEAFLRATALEMLEKGDYVSAEWYFKQLEALKVKGVRGLRALAMLLQRQYAVAARVLRSPADPFETLLLTVAELGEGKVAAIEPRLKTLKPFSAGALSAAERNLLERVVGELEQNVKKGSGGAMPPSEVMAKLRQLWKN